MACDCKSNRQILELGRRYGTGSGPTMKDILKSGLWSGIQKVFLGIFAILAMPFIFLFVAYQGVVKGENVIHFDKIFKLNNVRE